MNAKCPKCGTLHTNLNYDTNYSCHVCKDTFHLITPTNAPQVSSGDGFWLLCKLAAFGISLYCLYLCSTL